MPNPLVDKLRSVVSGPIEGAGYELVELEWKRETTGWVVRVFIDRPAHQQEPGAVTGVSLSDCERVSRELSAVLDVSDVVPQQYSLEVSSPGLDRPLRTRAHFARFVGKRAKVKLHNGVDGRRNFAGTIKAVPDDEPARVEFVVDDGKEYVLPLSDLEKANLVYELNGINETHN
jgi:ribosome maturation factor RimP